jgi:hypothetical protein
LDGADVTQAREWGVTTLFRAVGFKEIEQIRTTGRLETVSWSLSGKSFAETPEHATRWGELLEGHGKYIVVKAELSSEVADTLFRIERLDGIGPARYVEADQLDKVRLVGEVGE